MGLTSCFSCFKSPKGEKQHEGLNASKNSAQGTNTSHLHHEKPASSVAHGHGNVSNADTDHHAVLSKTSQACSSVYYSAAGSFISRSNSIDRTLHSNSIELIPADQQAGGAGGAYRISLSSVPIQPGSPVSATASAVQQQPAGTDEESGKEQAVQVAPPIDLALLQNPTELYKWHPLQACKAAVEYCRSIGKTPDEVLAGIQLPPGQAGYQLERILMMAAAQKRVLETIHDDSSWQVVRDDVHADLPLDDPGRTALKIMYKHTKGSTIHHFKGRCMLETPIPNLVALVREFDLIKTVIDYISVSLILHEHSPVDMLALAGLWMPWPFNNINVAVEASGTDLLDELGTFLVSFHTPKEMMPGVEVPPNAQPHPGLAVLPGSCMHIVPILPTKPGGNPRLVATMEFHVDTGMKFVPPFIITFLLKTFGPYMYHTVVKLMVQSFDSPDKVLPQRMKGHPVYPFLQARMDSYMAQLAAKGGKVGGAQGAGRAPTANGSAAASVKGGEGTGAEAEAGPDPGPVSPR